MMNGRPLIPKLYGALLELSSSRETVRGLGSAVGESQSARFMARLDSLEAETLRLLDECETRHQTTAH